MNIFCTLMAFCFIVAGLKEASIEASNAADIVGALVLKDSKKHPLERVTPIYPIMKRQRTELPLTMHVIDVAQFFLNKMKSTSELGACASKLKQLEELLFWAQGYGLALYDVPLFNNDELIKSESGIAIRTIRAIAETSARAADKLDPILPETIATEFNEKTLSERNILLLNGVWLLFQDSLKAGGTDELLGSVNSDRSAAVTALDCIRDRFRLPVVWARFVACLMDSVQSDDQVQEILTYAREYLSYGYFGVDDLTAVRNCFEARQSDFERAAKLWKSFELVRWPGQSIFQAVMGYLFYPLQYELVSEPIQSLKMRENLQVLLAISASYKYLPSMYYIARVLEYYSNNDSDAELPVVEVIEKFFGNTARVLADACLKVPGEGQQLPPYFCGILCEEQFEPDKAALWFLEGMKKGDKLCLFRYSCSEEAVVGGEKEVSDISQISQALAFVARAVKSPVREEAVELYRLAGELGLGYAFRDAGDLCKSSKNEQLRAQAFQYYLRAAQNHILEAYDELAQWSLDICTKLKKEDSERVLELRKEAKSWLESAAMRGHKLAYFELMRLRRQDKDYEGERRCWELLKRNVNIVPILRVLVEHENK